MNNREFSTFMSSDLARHALAEKVKQGDDAAIQQSRELSTMAHVNNLFKLIFNQAIKRGASAPLIINKNKRVFYVY